MVRILAMVVRGCDDGWRMVDDVVWRVQNVGECLSFCGTLVDELAAGAGVFAVCLGKRSGLWSDVARVRLWVLR